jgi:hypothetical protein
MAEPTLLHRGYLYAQKIFVRMRALAESHPMIMRMRLANAWRDGYIAGQREQQLADMHAVKRISNSIEACERILASYE